MGHDSKFSVSTTTDLWIIDVSQYLTQLQTQGESQPLTADAAQNITRPMDRPVGGAGSEIGFRGGASITWQGDRLVFLMCDRGAGGIYQVVPGGETQALLVDRALSVASVAAGQETIAYIASAPNQPDELYLLREDPVPVTQLNTELMAGITLGDWEEFQYSSDDGQPIDGWLLYPADFDPARKYPLVLLIHGGPHGSYGPTFMFTAQVFTAQGYVVLYTNPRGSDTYGQEFTKWIDKNWGDRDYADVMAGVDAAINRGFIDPERMFVHGWSYGGYLSCWIATQTNRFKAICAGASVTNMLSGYGTSDITLADEYEYGGQPWRDYEHLIKHSPIGHVSNVDTPIMLMHGEGDLRVAPSQTEEFYIALRRLGKEAIMIRYPGEYHGPRRLIHRLDRFQRLVAWFNYYRDL